MKMTKHSNTYKTFDIVVVPFPFVDSAETKNRPAIIISSVAFNTDIEHSILAMITSSGHITWPNDTKISQLPSCGLIKPSIIRLKLFTLDHRLIKEKIGSLSTKDQKTLQHNFLLAFDELMQEI
ncbi:MAG: type II toxin-antitoxin system PemK/MazF family toxin [Candidatus Babeliales bacterium]|nr:type II toxin-antitoxin system PemK/MazF family toxin [Candidatus Babeliales bacterium]